MVECQIHDRPIGQEQKRKEKQKNWKAEKKVRAACQDKELQNKHNKMKSG